MKKILIVLVSLTLLTNCKKENGQTGENNHTEQDSITGENNNQQGNDAIPADNVEISLQKAEDGSYAFRYNLKKGETYPFSLKLNMVQSMSDGTTTEKMTSSRTMDVTYFVEESNAGKFKLKATFKSFSEEFNSPQGEKLSYNTNSVQPADKDVAQSWKIYKAITGESFQMEIDDKGKVLKITGLDKVNSAVQSKLKNDFNADEQKLLGELLKETLSEEFMRMQFEESLNIFPDKPMKIGDEWEDSQNISEGPIKGTNKVTRTLKSIKGNIATIAVNGVQNVNGKETQEGITMSLSNHATLDGSIDLDVESGWVKKLNINKSETVKRTMEGQGRKQTLTQTSTTKTTVN